jgi:hypothetical protein
LSQTATRSAATTPAGAVAARSSRSATAPRPLSRVVLIHFNPPNLEKRIARLTAGGHAVEALLPKGPDDLKALRADPPDAFVVDLDRRPSEGRSIGVMLRRYASTRPVPLVFAGGEDSQVARVRNLLPDATFTSWERVRSAVSNAKAPTKPVVPGAMGAYSQTALEPKLGVRDGTTIRLVHPPDGFEKALRRAQRVDDSADVVLLFVRDAGELERDFVDAKASIAPGGSLWICWPKRTSALASDLTQVAVRRYAMDRGLVDFKVAAIDGTWSGLRFARKKR